MSLEASIAAFICAVSECVECAAILLAAIVGAGSVAWQIRVQWKLAQRDSTVKLIQALQKDKNLSSAVNLVTKIHTDKQDNVEFYASRDVLEVSAAKSESDEEYQERIRVCREKSHALTTVVNYFEMASVGIRQNIYDKEIFRAHARFLFTEMLKRTKPFIFEIRKNSDYSAFGENFQSVAEEFESKK